MDIPCATILETRTERFGLTYMKGPMDIPEQSNDPILDKFDKWLENNRIEARANILEKVRANLLDSSSTLDREIDTLFRQDVSLFDDHMVWKIRSRLADNQRQSSVASTLSKWLAPVAAAATIALAVISFQSQGPKPVENQQTLASVDNIAAVDLNEDLMQILALASNLESKSDVTKLESMENLSFLFE